MLFDATSRPWSSRLQYSEELTDLFRTAALKSDVPTVESFAVGKPLRELFRFFGGVATRVFRTSWVPSKLHTFEHAAMGDHFIRPLLAGGVAELTRGLRWRSPHGWR